MIGKCEEIWWTWSGSNRRPLPCHGSALPAAPQAHTSGSPGTGIREKCRALIFAGISGIVKRLGELWPYRRERSWAGRGALSGLVALFLRREIHGCLVAGWLTAPRRT